MKLTKRELPWHHWFAWRPVQDWNTGQWYWLERVWRKYRVDGSGSRWYYQPILSPDEIAARELREREISERRAKMFRAAVMAVNRDSTSSD